MKRIVLIPMLLAAAVVLLSGCNEKMPAEEPGTGAVDPGIGEEAVDPDFRFFSDQDIANIRQSAKTTWGLKIVESMEKNHRQRLKYTLAVPLTEGGWGHHFYCPVHNTELTFSWTSPHAHRCAQCGTDYTGTQYDMAWIGEAHNKNLEFMLACMYLYITTGTRDYADRITYMLADYATRYPTWQPHSVAGPPNGSEGRMYSQSLDEAGWMTDAAVAYRTVKPLVPARYRTLIEDSLFRPSAELIMACQATNNWQTWHNAAIASIGVALEDDDLIDYAIDTPVYGYDDLLDANLYADGWWNEGSVSYHFYALQAMVKTAEAVRCRGIDLYDSRIRSMFRAPVNSVYSNLAMVTHNDGWTGAKLTSYARYYNIAYLRYGNEQFFDNVLNACYKQVDRLNYEALLNPKEISGSGTLSLESCAFDNMGYAVLHNGANTVIMKYGPHGGGHGHPDKLSITLHDGTKELLPDFGTPAYGVPAYGGWYKKSLSHNTVSIAGADQAAVTGTKVSFSTTSTGGVMEALAPGTYPGVEMSRRVELSGMTLDDTFTCTSSTSHDYDYVLLLTEKPTIAGGASASLTGDPVFAYITNVKRYDYTAGFTVKLAKTKFTLEAQEGDIIDIFVGEAPGYPNRTSETTPCYPVIVRVRGNNMQLNVAWNLASNS